jgi:hypothetical protein
VGPISPFSPLWPSGPFETISHNASSMEPTFPNSLLLITYLYYKNLNITAEAR